MLLSKLSINSFRNLEDQNIGFSEGVNLILGENGQGKTSILEAIYILSQGKSFREKSNKHLIQWQKKGFEVCGQFDGVDGSKSLSIKLENSRKTVKINENKINSAEEFFGTFTAVSFTPDDLDLVKGGSINRRSFIDQTLAMIAPQYVHNLVSYQRALKSRNLILASYFSGRDKVELGPWNKILADLGLKIALFRRDFIIDFREYFIENYSKISGNQEGSDIKYDSQFFDNDIPLENEQIEEKYQNSFSTDLKFRSTRIGVHRDKIDFCLNLDSGQVFARNNASQGQARSISLAAKISAAKFVSEKKNESPVLLLDDVQSELDQGRLNRLFDLLFSLNGQVIITATEKVKLPILESQKLLEFSVKKGRLSS